MQFSLYCGLGFSLLQTTLFTSVETCKLLVLDKYNENAVFTGNSFPSCIPSEVPFYVGIVAPFSFVVVTVSIVLCITIVLVLKKELIYLPKSWIVTRWVVLAIFTLAWVWYFVGVRLAVEGSLANMVYLTLEGVFLGLLGLLGLLTLLLSLCAKKSVVASKDLIFTHATKSKKGEQKMFSIKIQEATASGEDNLELRSISKETELESAIHEEAKETALVTSITQEGESEGSSTRREEDVKASEESFKQSSVPSITTSATAEETRAQTTSSSSDNNSMAKSEINWRVF